MSDTVTIYPLPPLAETPRADCVQLSMTFKSSPTFDRGHISSCTSYLGEVTNRAGSTTISWTKGRAYSMQTALFIDAIDDILPRKATNISACVRFVGNCIAPTESPSAGSARLTLGQTQTLPTSQNLSERVAGATEVTGCNSEIIFTPQSRTYDATVPIISHIANKNTAISALQSMLDGVYLWFVAINTDSSSTQMNFNITYLTAEVSYSLPEPQGVPISTKANGEWHEGGIFVKENGEWFDVSEAFVKLNGEWKEIRTSEE